MLVAVDASAFRNYTLKRDKAPKDLKDGETFQPTIFEIGVLDGLLGPALMDKHTLVARKGSVSSVDMKPGSYQRDLVRFGLKGWKNFALPNGKPAEFNRTQINVAGVGPRWAVDDKCLAMLASEWIAELANEIMGDNKVSEDDEKNSDPPSEN